MAKLNSDIFPLNFATPLHLHVTLALVPNVIDTVVELVKPATLTLTVQVPPALRVTVAIPDVLAVAVFVVCPVCDTLTEADGFVVIVRVLVATLNIFVQLVAAPLAATVTVVLPA